MTQKLAVINANDTGAVESLANMLERVGYRCLRPTMHALLRLRNIGLEGITDSLQLQIDYGYDPPTVPMEAEWEDVCNADLFVDLKAHVNHPKIIQAIPYLKGKVLWYCINGGDPLKRKGLDKTGHLWTDPPCPVITPNQWHQGYGYFDNSQPVGQCGKHYTFWPKFMRAGEYTRRKALSPVCFVHNVGRWGYGHLVETARKLGVLCHGVNAPEGMVPRTVAKTLMENAICMVHLKVGDSVGYALLEAVAARCPIVCSQFYIDECKLGEFLIPEKTCLTFDPDPARFEGSLRGILERLADPVCNAVIAENAWARCDALTWNDEAGLKEWLNRNFN